MGQRVSAKDVAKLAGVSRAAVSRTFSDGQVSAKIRERVKLAAEELGYRPNAIARSLIGGKTNLIALIVAETDSIHNGMLIERLTIEITRRGKRSLVIPVLSDVGIDESTLNAADYQVDAILVIGGTVSPKIIKRLGSVGVPILLYERRSPEPELECVIGDSFNGGRLAARYLTRLGHERISYITKPLRTHSNKVRREGLEDGLTEAGLDIFSEVTGEQGFRGGYNAAIEMFSRQELPHAVFCFNDEMAIGALQAAAALKIRVPDDISVMGYDDIPMSAWPAFALSTIHNAIEAPVQILLDRAAALGIGGKREKHPHIIEPELIVRGTTG